MDSFDKLLSSHSLRSFDELGSTLKKKLDTFHYTDEEKKKLRRYNTGIPDVIKFTDPTIPDFSLARTNIEEWSENFGGSSAKTLSMLASVLKNFIYFNVSMNLYPFPARSATVLAYLRSLARDGRKLNTLNQHKSQISQIHQIAEWPDPTKSKSIRAFFNNYQREKYELTNKTDESDQAAPFRKTHLDALIQIWYKSDLFMHTRDLALLSTAYATGLREDELMRIQYKHLMIGKDGTITIKRTIGKKNRTGLPPKLLVGNFAHMLQRYIDRFPDVKPEDYLFVRLNSHGTGFFKKKAESTPILTFTKPLSGKTVDHVFERAYLELNPSMSRRKSEMIELAGADIVKSDLDPDGAIWSGHSARIGLLWDMAADRSASYTDLDYMSVGDWTSMKMVQWYLRNFAAESSASTVAQKRNDIQLPE
jgi:integrase